ncbi:hypothetical protein Taro_011716 [Colocasia esculenta]|uniref:Uncharacterized protein n=1 Tax=Colocasia esculenta TaxID=4460 RepID=A0A843UGY2_COLES|nr:hypothetical protein [Colocasia esculenta]
MRPESHDTSTNIPDLHKVRKEQPGVTTRDTGQPALDTPREPAERKSLNTAHEAKPTKPTAPDTARLQPPCKLGQRETHSQKQCEKHRHTKATKPPPQVAKRRTHSPLLQLANH